MASHRRHGEQGQGFWGLGRLGFWILGRIAHSHSRIARHRLPEIAFVFGSIAIDSIKKKLAENRFSLGSQGMQDVACLK